jgi:hypothetical protein
VAKLIFNIFNKVKSKNKGWKNIKQMNQVLIGETTNDDDLIISNFNLNFYLCMKYSNRQCLTEDSLFK